MRKSCNDCKKVKPLVYTCNGINGDLNTWILCERCAFKHKDQGCKLTPLERYEPVYEETGDRDYKDEICYLPGVLVEENDLVFLNGKLLSPDQIISFVQYNSYGEEEGSNLQLAVRVVQDDVLQILNIEDSNRVVATLKDGDWITTYSNIE